MSLVNEFNNRRENPPTEVAKRILFDVFDDIDGRGGLGWKFIDDDECKEEILRTNLEKIRRHL